MTGHSFEETNSIMQSPFFNTIAKLSKRFGMSAAHTGITSDNIIKFMSLQGNLPFINSKALRFAVGAFASNGLNNCFLYKLAYETDANGNLIGKNGKTPNSKNDLIPRENPLYFYKLNEENKLEKIVINQKYVDAVDKDSKIKDNDYKYWLTSKGTVTEFIKHLKSTMSNFSHEDLLSGRSRRNTANTSFDFNEEFNEFQSDFEQDESFEESESISEETLTEGNESDKRMLLRYAEIFLKERANILETQDFDTFNTFVQKILPITEEQNITGMSLGVNQGIPTNEFDFYNRLHRIENFVNKAYQNNKLDTDFDILRFIRDSEYKNVQIDKYESIKTGLNPLAIISGVPNFKQMFDFYGLADTLLDFSVQYKLDFALAKQILKGDNTKRLNAKEFKTIHDTIKDSLILSWLKQQNLDIKLPIGQLLYLPRERGEIKSYYTPLPNYELALNTVENLATFKHLMDSYIFPKMRSQFRDNAFVRAIDSRIMVNKLHDQLVMRKRMPINMMSTDDSEISKERYNNIAEAFGDIANNTEFLKSIGVSNGDVKLGDLIYLYNLLVYKDSFGQDSFTRIFEQMNIYTEDSLINKFYTWLSNIDSATREIEDINSINVNGNYSIGDSNFEIKVEDLLYRLSVLKNADKRLGIVADRQKGIRKIQFTDKFGNITGRSLNVKNPNASDFPLELPFSGGAIVSDAEFKTMGFDENDIQQKFRPNSDAVWDATTDAIDDLVRGLGRDNDFVVITYDMIQDWIANPESAPFDIKDQNLLRRISRAHGFIYNGKIYINRSNPNYQANTKIHELGHAVSAMMKFSKNESQRVQYYKWIEDNFNEMQKRYTKAELQQKAEDMGFKTIHNSDFKEELLVDQIATAFKVGVENTVFADGNGKFSKNTLRTRIFNAVKSLLNLDINDESLIKKLGNTSIVNAMAMFGKYAQSLDSNSLRFTIDSAKYKAIKNTLTKTSQTEYNNTSNGIYYKCE